MANRYFDWVVRTATQRFIARDTIRSTDANAALDLVTAGFDALPRGVCFGAYAGTATNNVANATDTKINFDTEWHDPDGAFASSRFTVPANGGGYYHFDAQIEWAAKATETLAEIILYKNGAAFVRGFKRTVSADVVAAIRCSVSADALLVAGDYVEVYGRHGGSARNTVATVNSFFTGHQIRAVGAQG